MNLDPLTFSLAEIEYEINTLYKASFRYNASEIKKLIDNFGFESEKHLYKAIFHEIDFDKPNKEIISLKLFNDKNITCKPNFLSLICSAIENVVTNQKEINTSTLLFNLSKAAKLTKLEEIVYALCLKHSSIKEIKNVAVDYLKLKLPDFIKHYTDGKITLLNDVDINCDIIYALFVTLLIYDEDLGINKDLFKNFKKTLHKDFPISQVPIILAPLLYSHLKQRADYLPIKKITNELPAITKTMVDVSKLVVELGYDFCFNLEACQTNLIEIGVHEITPASVARILGAMANSHAGLNKGISLYFDNKDPYPPTFEETNNQIINFNIPITTDNTSQNFYNATTNVISTDTYFFGNRYNNINNQGLNGSKSTTWNADIFVRAVKEVVPHFHWRDVVYELDQPGLVLKDKPGFKLIVGAITQGLESNMETFPYDYFYRTWNNSEEQLSWLEMIVRYPDVFRFADFPSRQVSTDILKLNPDEDCDPRAAIWKSLDMIEALLKLSEHGHYQRVQDIFRYPLQHCPDVLIIALLQIKGLLTLLGQDLLATLIPHFLINNSNSLIVLQIAWHNQFHSHITRTLIMHSMADWYARDPNDQTRLSRILDIAQDLKALSLLLNCSPYGFIIDLACLASRREYLKLEKWLAEKIREHAEPFLWALIYFLKRRCPAAFLNMTNSNSTVINLLCSDIKDSTLPKALQLPPDIVNVIMTTLQNFLSNYYLQQQQNQSQAAQSLLNGKSSSLFFPQSNTASFTNFKSSLSGNQNSISPELNEILTNLLGIKSLNNSSLMTGHIGTNGSRQNTPYEQQQQQQAFQPSTNQFQQNIMPNTGLGNIGGTPGLVGNRFNSQLVDQLLLNQSNNHLTGIGVPLNQSNLAGASSLSMNETVRPHFLDGLLAKAMSGICYSSIKPDSELDINSFTKLLQSLQIDSSSSSQFTNIPTNNKQSLSITTTTTSSSFDANENNNGEGNNTNITIPTNPYTLDLSAMFPDVNMTCFSKDIEDEANTYFQRIYNRPPHPIMCLQDFLIMLKKFYESTDYKEREVFACMIRNLYDEYRFFSTYPDKELHITSCLFGGLIEKGICNYIGLGIALRFVLDALTKPISSDKTRYFGLTALDTFKNRLKEYPQYCYLISQIPHYAEEFPSYIKEYIEHGMKSQSPPVNSKVAPPNPSKSFTPPFNSILVNTTNTTLISSSYSSSTAPALINTQSSTTDQIPISSTTSVQTNPLLLLNPDSLLLPSKYVEPDVSDTNNIHEPPEATQDKIFFLFNNLSLANINQKTEEVMDLLTDENLPWAANYITMKRVSIENNFHTLYSNFLNCINKPKLSELVIIDTFKNIKNLLKGDKAVGNFSDRSLLKNLGHWLGLLTIAKNKPLLQNEIDLKQLILDAAIKGIQELLYIIPFAAKILEACSKSKVFKPPNPWTMGIMHLLSEIHQEPDMKLNLKFEIEMLCKTLNLDISELYQKNKNELGRYKQKLVLLTSFNEQSSKRVSEDASLLSNITSNMAPQYVQQQLEQYRQQLLQTFQTSQSSQLLPPSKANKFDLQQANKFGATSLLPPFTNLSPHMAGYYNMLLNQSNQNKDGNPNQQMLMEFLNSFNSSQTVGSSLSTPSTNLYTNTNKTISFGATMTTSSSMNLNAPTTNLNSAAADNRQQQFLASLLANINITNPSITCTAGHINGTLNKLPSILSSLITTGSSNNQNALMQQQFQQMLLSNYGQQQQQNQQLQQMNLNIANKYPGLQLPLSVNASSPPTIFNNISTTDRHFAQQPFVSTGMISPKYKYTDIDISNGSLFLSHKIYVNSSIFKNDIQTVNAFRHYARIAMEKTLTDILPPLIDKVMRVTVSTAENLIKKDFAFDSDENRVRASSHQLIRFLAGGISLYTAREPLYGSLITNFKNALTIGLKGNSSSLTSDHINKGNIGSGTPGVPFNLSNLTNNTSEFIEHAANVLATDNFELACCFAQKSAIERTVNELDRRWAFIYLAASNKPRSIGSRTTLSACMTSNEVEIIDALPLKVKPRVGNPNPNLLQVYELLSKGIPGFQSSNSLNVLPGRGNTFSTDMFAGRGAGAANILGALSKSPFYGAFSSVQPSGLAESDSTGFNMNNTNEMTKFRGSPSSSFMSGSRLTGNIHGTGTTTLIPYMHSRVLAKLGVELDKALLTLGIVVDNTVVNINVSNLELHSRPLVSISVLVRNIANVLTNVKDVSSSNLNIVPLNLTSILGVNQPSTITSSSTASNINNNITSLDDTGANIIISNTVLSGFQTLINKCLEGLQLCFKAISSLPSSQEEMDKGDGTQDMKQGQSTFESTNILSNNTFNDNTMSNVFNENSNEFPSYLNDPVRIKETYLRILKTLQDSRVFGPLLVNKQITKCLMENKDDVGIDLELFYFLYWNELINTQLYDTFLSQCVLDNTLLKNGTMTDVYITKIIAKLCCDEDCRHLFPLAESDFFKTIDALFHFISRPGRRFNLELNQTLIKLRENSNIVFFHTFFINLASPTAGLLDGSSGGNNTSFMASNDLIINNLPTTIEGSNTNLHAANMYPYSGMNNYTGIFHLGVSASKDFDDPPGLKEKITYLYREWMESYYGTCNQSASLSCTSLSPPNMLSGGGPSNNNFTTSPQFGGIGAAFDKSFNHSNTAIATGPRSISTNPEAAISNFMMQMHQQGIFKTDDTIMRFLRICTEICLNSCYAALAERSNSSLHILNKQVGALKSIGTSSTEQQFPNFRSQSQHSQILPNSSCNTKSNSLKVGLEERYKKEIEAQIKCFSHTDAYVKMVSALVKNSNQSLNNGAQVNLMNKVLGTLVGFLIRYHSNPPTCLANMKFQCLPFYRLLSILYAEIISMQALMETHGENIMIAFSNAFHLIRPSEAPGFAYSWLDLIGHRTFIGKTFSFPPKSKMWNYYALLLADMFKFSAPYLRNLELSDSLMYFYNGGLRILLVLLHDFPEFLCDYHYGFCDIIPPNCIQVRNLILSAFPRDMRLPDPFTPNLRVDNIPEIANSPKCSPFTDYSRLFCEHSMMCFVVPENNLNEIKSHESGIGGTCSIFDSAGISETELSTGIPYQSSSQTSNISNETVLEFKNGLDMYLKTRSTVTFLTDIRSNLQRNPTYGSHYNIPLLNALVMYVGTQAISNIQNKGMTPGLSTISHSSHMDVFQNLAVALDTEGRYLFLSSIANQLRYPNSHTHYFSCILLYLFAEANIEAIQEQITRVLLERLIVNRPHPWGLLVTFVELIKNPAFNFWAHDFVRCAPEIEKLFREYL